MSQSNSSAKKAQVQAQFARTAEDYVSSRSHSAGWDLQRLLELGELDPTLRVLDVATGGGHTALAVAPLVAEVVVSDLTPQMLARAQAFITAQGVSNAQFVEADAEHLPFAVASFDRVTCRIAPHHFPDIGQFVQEVARVLRPGGLFLLIDCLAPSEKELDLFDNKVEKWRDPSHGRSLNKEEWFAFIQQADLSTVHWELFRKTHNYDEWTARSQMPVAEKHALAAFMLASASPIQQHFVLTQKSDGTLQSFTNDYIFLKARKK